MKLPIKKAKFLELGGSYYLLIPKQYITNGLLSAKKKYDIEIELKETSEDEKEQ